MVINQIGKIAKITGAKVLIRVTDTTLINRLGVERFNTSYISIGSLLGTSLVDGRILALIVEEIYDSGTEILITSSISGIYDEVLSFFSFGTNTYPLIGESVFKLTSDILCKILAPAEIISSSTIGTYIYDNRVAVGYNPNVLFGKHLGVFGNTGSGKTCTIVSTIQNYIRNNPNKDIKYVILDVNGEYRSAFNQAEAEYIKFEDIRFHHCVLSNPEYGKLFRAAEGVQYPALRECIKELRDEKKGGILQIFQIELKNGLSIIHILIVMEIRMYLQKTISAVI